MSAISWCASNPKKAIGLTACPLVGTSVPICLAKASLNLDILSEPKVKSTIAKTSAIQLLSCGIAGTAAYLLWDHAVFAAVLKISAIFGGIVLGVTSFFIAPAVILGLYLIYNGCCYLKKHYFCCYPSPVVTNSSGSGSGPIDVSAFGSSDSGKDIGNSQVASIGSVFVQEV